MIAQIAAAAIFSAMFALIVTDKIKRHTAALYCGAMTVIVVFGFIMKSYEAFWNTINLKSIFETEFWYHKEAAPEESAGVNWSTIIFITGMMLMVEVMARTGFFKWLCVAAARAVGFKVRLVFFSSMILSALLAMFIDSITVILFLAAVTIELSETLKFNPVPFILAEIFCANLGGAATMCGDPPNIIIGTSLGYTFGDFILNTGPIAAFSLVVITIFFYLRFKNEIRQSGEPEEYPSPKEMITDKKGFALSGGMFAIAAALLATHGLTGITAALIGVVIGISALLISRRDAASVIKKIDYGTLLFFIGLFIVVGGLEQTGILKNIAALIGNVSGKNTDALVIIIIWMSGIASAFVDNIPFTAAMIPIIKALSESCGVPLEVLAWSLAVGTDIGGNATPVGASANLAGISAARRKGYLISWRKYCKHMIPASFIIMTLGTVLIIYRYL